MKRIVNFIFTLIFMGGSNALQAQDNCKDALYDANKLFETGKINECISRLEPCLKSQKDKEERIESYHLLALAYQAANNLEKANGYVKKLLLLKPDYQKFSNIDPMDFTRLVNQYRVTPKLRLGLQTGFNTTWVQLNKSYSLFPSLQRYNPVLGLQAGIMSDYLLNNGFAVQANLIYNRVTINHVIDSAANWQQDYKELENYFMLTLLATKHFVLYKKLSAYIGLGATAGYLKRASVSLDATNLSTKVLQQVTKDPTPERIRFQPAANIIAGFSYPIANGELCVEGNFLHFFNNTVNSAKRYDDINFIFNNQYLNDDISLRQTMVNVIYKFPFVWQVKNK